MAFFKDKGVYIGAVIALGWGLSLASNATDYKAEAKAALKGQAWYSSSFIPSQEELKGQHPVEEENSSIKVRLPLDLERIINDYRSSHKPISLAVSCGDRELPWRINFAYQQKNSSRPTDQDYWDYLPTAVIDHSLNKENFISLDPLLGIQMDEEESSSENKSVKIQDARGAGHISMDAMNREHWHHLGNFLKVNKIKVHQIIFTAGMGAPLESLFGRTNFFPVQWDMLESSGKLVEPYFINYSKKYSPECFTFLRIAFPQPGLGNFEEFMLTGQSDIKKLFYQSSQAASILNNKRVLTKYPTFIRLLDKKLKGNEILSDLHLLIAQHFSSSTQEYRTFLEEISFYFISSFNPQAIFSKEMLNSNACLYSEEEQIKAIIPIYKKYIETQGYIATFLTSSKIAKVFNIPQIQAQQWVPGDYPYGERGHIALVIQKKN